MNKNISWLIRHKKLVNIEKSVPWNDLRYKPEVEKMNFPIGRMDLEMNRRGLSFKERECIYTKYGAYLPFTFKK